MENKVIDNTKTYGDQCQTSDTGHTVTGPTNTRCGVILQVPSNQSLPDSPKLSNPSHLESRVASDAIKQDETGNGANQHSLVVSMNKEPKDSETRSATDSSENAADEQVARTDTDSSQNETGQRDSHNETGDMDSGQKAESGNTANVHVGIEGDSVTVYGNQDTDDSSNTSPKTGHDDGETQPTGDQGSTQQVTSDVSANTQSNKSTGV